MAVFVSLVGTVGFAIFLGKQQLYLRTPVMTCSLTAPPTCRYTEQTCELRCPVPADSGNILGSAVSQHLAHEQRPTSLQKGDGCSPSIHEHERRR